MAEKLNDESIRGWLRGRPGWKRDGKYLRKDFSFPTFRNTIVFVNRIASIADDLSHYPDIDIRYDKVRLSVTTKDAKGITQKDIDFAERVEYATSAR
ncbi:MAG: 4a-hydroxytetrahydrobiopterin dehydratase [Gemmatimonadota bacterium]|nr:MAG: 4a-hydroxytetrahydrobiopterin dehydratase [Gemmatimonadota bacterium]